MTSNLEEGPAYTTGDSFRARAEARQRRFRAETLRAGWNKHGHLLDETAVEAGANFHHDLARAAAERRAAAGKGVDRSRTFGNMLSSQAMCFNVFGPLAATEEGRTIAARALAPCVPGLAAVRRIEIEHTPSPDIFGDQSRFGGVDCDLLIEFEDAHRNLGILVVETKYVEAEFSCCGFRTKKKEEDRCPKDVHLGADFSGCRYATKRRYLYWERTKERRTLRLPLAEEHCPFAGPLWQLWVNHTLAHEEAARRGASRAVFGVCAPEANDALLDGGAVLDEFRRLTSDPSTVVFIPLERLLAEIITACGGRKPWTDWAALLQQRYG